MIPSITPSRVGDGSELGALIRNGDNGRRRVALATLALAVLTLGLWWEATGRGVVVEPDSAVYLSTAENVSAGKGVTSPLEVDANSIRPDRLVRFGERVPLGSWPPLYPVEIAVVHKTGLGILSAARLINGIALLSFVLVLGWTLWVIQRPSWVLALAVLCPIFISPTASLNLSAAVLSEPPFLPICFFALMAAALALSRHSRKWFAIAVALIAAATLTRYVGVAIGGAFGLAVACFGRGKPVERALGALLAMGSGVIAIVSWSLVSRLAWGAPAPRQLAWHPHSPLDGLLQAYSTWFHLSPGWPIVLRWGLIAILAGGPIAVVLTPYLQKLLWAHPLDPEGAGDLLAITIGLFVLTYIATLVVTIDLFDALTPLDQRLLSPLQAATYLLLAVVTVRCVQGRASGRIDATVASTMVLLLFAPLLILNAARVPSLIHRLRRAGTVQAELRRTAPANRLPERLLVFTNDPQGVWLYSHHPAYMVPLRRSLTTLRSNAKYPDDIRQVANLVVAHAGIVWLTPQFFAGLQVSPADYTLNSSLQIVATCRDGSELLAAPASPAATSASSVCPPSAH